MNHDIVPPIETFGFFVALVDAFADVRPKKAGHNIKGQESKYVTTLKNWVKTVQTHHEKVPRETVATFFRLFFPEEDVSRKYGLQETRLSGYIADVFGVSMASGDRGASLRAWNAENAVGCLGVEVKKLLEGTASPSHTADTRSMAEINALLTELAGTSAFSSAGVRGPHTSRRKPREIITDLFKPSTPSSAALLTQIILKDLRPLLYPLKETHYTAQLLQYNSKAVCMLSKEEAMKIWDPSGKMSQAYRMRASLEEAAAVFDNADAFVQPEVGVPIPIPKCVKGSGCKNALSQFRHSKKVWVETKYDGERAQIHVQVDEGGKSRITIFSKSKRDSTLDRFGVHPIIREALGLPDPSIVLDVHDTERRHDPRIKQNIVLEAEMVAFSDPLNRIDEFWRIRSLIASTAIGVRASRKKALPESQDNDWSQSSLMSNADDHGTRHLALVFFDILVLDSKSLLWEPYSKRRALLESIIQLRPRYAMLADRVPISMTYKDQAVDDLIHVFAGLQADHQEGAVLKADESRYNDWSLRWVKLKADYIPGYGDCLDMVLLGAGWDKERARELLVSASTFTTFYVGARLEGSGSEKESRSKPHFQVIFTVSYGLSREQLEELNFLIKSSDPASFSDATSAELQYSFSLNHGIVKPSVMLRQPLLCEVYGAGFTKAPRSKFYELRFPRMTKYHRASERPWNEGTTMDEFNRVARESVGRDRPNKDVDDWCNNVWGKSSSPGVRCEAKRQAREEEWVEKLAKADGKLKVKARKLDFMSAVHTLENCGNATSNTPQPTSPKPPLSRAFGSVTNVLLTPSDRPPTDGASRRVRQLPTPGPSANLLRRTIDSKHSRNVLDPPVLFKTTPRSPQSREHGSSIAKPNQTSDAPSEPSIVISSGAPIPVSTPAAAAELPVLPSKCSIRDFLKHGVVFISRDPSIPRPSWRAPTRSVVPHGQQVHCLDSLMIACGWSAIGQACDWANYGVVFVDDSGDEQRWTDAVLKPLLAWRTSATRTKAEKPIVILGLSLLKHDLLDKELNIIDNIICRLG